MKSPRIGRKFLALGLEAGIGGPKLSGEKKTAVCLGATRVRQVWQSLRRAREHERICKISVRRLKALVFVDGGAH